MVTETDLVKVLVVPAWMWRPARLELIRANSGPEGLAAMRRLVGGGWLEGIGASIQSGAWHGYADEEGQLKSLPLNPRATRLARRLGWPGELLVGDVVFLGNGVQGMEADVPTDVLEQATLLGMELLDEPADGE